MYIAFLDAFDDLVLRSEQLCALLKVLDDAAMNPDHDEQTYVAARALLSALMDENHAALTKLQKDFMMQENI